MTPAFVAGAKGIEIFHGSCQKKVQRGFEKPSFQEKTRFIAHILNMSIFHYFPMRGKGISIALPNQSLDPRLRGSITKSEVVVGKFYSVLEGLII